MPDARVFDDLELMRALAGYSVRESHDETLAALLSKRRGG